MKILMIGNSFSLCVGKNLPQIVKAGKKHTLELTSAYIGGCSLQTHAEHLAAAAQDPAFSPYGITFWDSTDLRRERKFRGNVLELLQNNQYDIVTVQQASYKSWNYETYHPWAEQVISCVRKYNPDAGIMIQQTWSYRNDCACFFNAENAWGFGSQEMYRRLCTAYDAFAADTGFEVIPTGDAVDIWRRDSGAIYEGLSAEELAEIRYPDLPPMAADVVGRDFWHKNEEGEMVLGKDANHLNFRGEYLQACVWYGKIFGEDPETIAYEPKNIGRSECQFLQKCAKKALAGRPGK